MSNFLLILGKIKSKSKKIKLHAWRKHVSACPALIIGYNLQGALVKRNSVEFGLLLGLLPCMQRAHDSTLNVITCSALRIERAFIHMFASVR